MEPITRISLEKLFPSSCNVRMHVSEEAVRRLAEDIAVRGLLHPLIVRREGEGYGVVCGRMRLEAIRLLQRERPDTFKKMFGGGVPCVVRELSDREAIELSLSENLRQNTLTPEERGRALARLYEMGLSEREIAERLLVAIDEVARAIQVYSRLKGVMDLVAAAKAGRPRTRAPRRRPRVSRFGALEVARAAEELARESPQIDADEVTKVVTELAAKHGLSMNEMRLVADKIVRAKPRSTQEVKKLAEKAVEEVRKADYRERVVLIRRDLLERLEAYAAERQVTFHEALNEVLEKFFSPKSK